MDKSTIIGTIAGAVTLFALGSIWYAMLMPGFYDAHTLEQAANVSKEQPDFVFLILGNIVVALVLSLVYPKWARGTHSAGHGFKFGALIGILLGVGMGLIWYSTANLMDLSASGIDAVFTVVQFGVAGAVIGLVFSKFGDE